MTSTKTATGRIMKDLNINKESDMDLDNKFEAMEKKSSDDRRRKAIAIVLAIVGVTILIGWNMKLSANLEEIKTQQDMLQGELAGISGSVSSTMDGFTQEIQEALHSQDSLLADYSVKEVSRDLKAGTVQYRISATPKTYQPGIKVTFVVNDGLDSTIVQGEEASHSFSATATCAFTDAIAISVNLKQDSKTQIQVLEKYEGMLSETLALVDEDFWSILNGMNPNAPEISESTYVAFINFNEYYTDYTDESNNANDVKVLDYYVLVNNKIVVSKTGKPGTQNWYGGDEEVIHGYEVEVPTNFLKDLKEGDRIVIAVLITDKYGRRYCANSSGLFVSQRSKGLIIEQDDTFVNDRTFGTDFK